MLVRPSPSLPRSPTRSGKSVLLGYNRCPYESMRCSRGVASQCNQTGYRCPRASTCLVAHLITVKHMMAGSEPFRAGRHTVGVRAASGMHSAAMLPALILLAGSFIQVTGHGISPFKPIERYIVCKDPDSQSCIVWLINENILNFSKNLQNNENFHKRCGLSTLKLLPPFRKYIKVTALNSLGGASKEIFCKSTKAIPAEKIDWHTAAKIITSATRVRRQSYYTPRGRFRGQTQSQYLSIDRGNGKDDGKAEANSFADSSRALVSGSSGMGQAQSQSFFDPTCEDCNDRSEQGVGNLKRPGGTANYNGQIPNQGSNGPNGYGWPNQGGRPGGSGGWPNQDANLQPRYNQNNGPSGGTLWPGNTGTAENGHRQNQGGTPSGNGPVISGPSGGRWPNQDGSSTPNGVSGSNGPNGAGGPNAAGGPNRAGGPNGAGGPDGGQGGRIGNWPYQGGINGNGPNGVNANGGNWPIQGGGGNGNRPNEGRTGGNWPNQGGTLHGPTDPTRTGGNWPSQGGNSPNGGVSGNVGNWPTQGVPNDHSGVGNWANQGGTNENGPSGIDTPGGNSGNWPNSGNVPNSGVGGTNGNLPSNENGPNRGQGGNWPNQDGSISGPGGNTRNQPNLGGSNNGNGPNGVSGGGNANWPNQGGISIGNGPNNRPGGVNGNWPIQGGSGVAGPGAAGPGATGSYQVSLPNLILGAGNVLPGTPGTNYYCCAVNPYSLQPGGVPNLGSTNIDTSPGSITRPLNGLNTGAGGNWPTGSNGLSDKGPNGGLGTSLGPYPNGNGPLGSGSDVLSGPKNIGQTGPTNIVGNEPYGTGNNGPTSNLPYGSNGNLNNGQHGSLGSGSNVGTNGPYGTNSNTPYGTDGNGVSNRPYGTGVGGSNGPYGTGAPGGSNGPYSSGTTGGPNGPYGTGAPGGPNGPYGSGTTGGPNGPYGTGAPGGSNGPYESGVPVGSNGPYGSGGPGGSNVPYGTSVTGGPNVPYGTGAPGGSTGPYRSGAPGGTSGPYGTGAPEGSNGPYGSGAPGGTGGPYGTSSPGGSSGPYGTGAPGGSSGPYGSGAPGGSYGTATPGGPNGPYGTIVLTGGSNGPYGTGVQGGSNGPYGTGVTGGSNVPYGSGAPGSSNGPYGTGAPGGSNGQYGTNGGPYVTSGIGGNIGPYGGVNTGDVNGPSNGNSNYGLNSPSGPNGVGTNGVYGANDGNSVPPQNVIDPNSIAYIDGDESGALASVSQIDNGTTASASANGGNVKDKAKTQVAGTYTGSGSFSAQAEITGENKGAQSEVTGDKKGASSNAQGNGRNSKSQASVQLGSETGAVLTTSQSDGAMHSSNSQVQGSVKGGMADAQARGPGSTSSQAQIGFTPYNEGDKGHESMKNPFLGGGTSSAQSNGRTGQSQSQIHGTFKYGISYNGAAQSGSSLDKDAVFPNKLPFNKIDVFDSKYKNINIENNLYSDPQQGSDGHAYDYSDKNETKNNVDSKYSNHTHSEHHKSVTLPKTDVQNKPTLTSSVGSRRSFQPYGSTPSDYTDAPENSPDDYADEFGDGNEEPEPRGDSWYPSYDDAETTHQSLQSSGNRKGLDVKQATGGNTQHIVVGSLNGRDAQITQKDTERPDERKVYQPGERVPGTGGYTIPIGFTGSVKSMASKDKTYVVGSKESPSQAQSVSLIPGTGKVKYSYPSGYGRSVNSKNLKSLYTPKADERDRYVSVSKSVTKDLDSDNNIRKQYSHTYYTKSSSCGYFTFTCTIVSGTEGRKKVCRPKIPTNPDGTPMRC